MYPNWSLCLVSFSYGSGPGLETTKVNCARVREWRLVKQFDSVSQLEKVILSGGTSVPEAMPNIALARKFSTLNPIASSVHSKL
jgi:hypothetical protein